MSRLLFNVRPADPSAAPIDFTGHRQCPVDGCQEWLHFFNGIGGCDQCGIFVTLVAPGLNAAIFAKARRRVQPDGHGSPLLPQPSTHTPLPTLPHSHPILPYPSSALLFYLLLKLAVTRSSFKLKEFTIFI